jgi:hypothetical protein
LKQIKSALAFPPVAVEESRFGMKTRNFIEELRLERNIEALTFMK